MKDYHGKDGHHRPKHTMRGVEGQGPQYPTVKSNQIEFRLVQTTDNIADLMTNAATKQKLEKFHRNLFEN